MPRRMWWAFVCHLLVSLFLAIFGLIYLFQPEFMPYHAAAVGRKWSAVDPAFQILILALMKVAGGAWLATAGAMMVLLFKPFREGARWVLWTVPAMGLTVAATSLYVTLYVAANTSATPPWLAAAFGVSLLVVGLILSLI